MANEYRDFPHAGRMTLKVTGGAGNVVVETDPEAVGARVYLDGPDGSASDVTFQHNGGSLEVIQARVAGGKAGGMSSTFRSDDGSVVQNSITGGSTGFAIQAGDIKGGIDLSGGGLNMGGLDLSNARIQVGGVDITPSGMGSAPTPVEGVDLHIVLPPGSDVELSGVAAEKIDFRGDFGDITTAKLDGSEIGTTGRFRVATLNLGSGEITVDHVAAGSTITADLRNGL